MSKTRLSVQRQDVEISIDDQVDEDGSLPKIEYDIRVEIDITTLINGDKRVLIESMDEDNHIAKVAEVIMKRVPDEAEKEAETKRCLELGLVGKDDLAGYDLAGDKV